MNWETWKKRLGLGRAPRPGHFVLPALALEVAPGFVAGACLSARSRRVERAGVRELAPDTVAPSPNKPNVADGTPIRAALADIVKLVGNPGGKLGLLIPDIAARVALLQFETLPDDRQQAESLVRWRMGEYLPYPPEEARITYQILVNQPEGVEVLAIAVRASVQAEYEAVLEGINGGPALVLPASVALLPLIPEDDSGHLLLHWSSGALTAVVLTQSRVLYWRTRPLEEGVEDSLQEVARETGRVLATAQDHFHLQIENVWFCSRPHGTGDLKRALAKALGRELRDLPGTKAQADTLPPGERDTFARFGMPFAGLVANLSESL
jgi:hypothetical protein